MGGEKEGRRERVEGEGGGGMDASWLLREGRRPW